MRKKPCPPDCEHCEEKGKRAADPDPAVAEWETAMNEARYDHALDQRGPQT